MSNTDLSRARARRPADYDSYDEKVKRLAKRARYDQYARYRSDVLPSGVPLAKYARDDVYSRYDTGEPHPLDNDGGILTCHVDPVTLWKVYRYDDNAVQPENGQAAYYDPVAARAQRERWAAEEREAAERSAD
eukprot:4775750-Pleurochrysis_carterae.AAC.1